ncbi:imidazole glycerol phosphate synthase subunit HisF [Roseobacter ponti]|uniref:Imidazole glycerol phosphate synthase subunit HisF n=1 Tax=Roseobacter ponti TaxID=1891787 RepID=A0A858SXU3_9RHOB|nr:imidazole glycerol phosphate synthase cyclase subunit [Roseobacter ponti]QJF52877.1 imidazole glycerol phosphate synthase subunit HisF [Roseobacter ponti]
MKNLRFIARLDVKGEHLVKGIQLEGLRKLGRPNDYARRYFAEGIDEILYIDIVASLYERNSLLPIIERATNDIFVPITVGGGIRSLDDARNALEAGADKVAINTAALRRPELISEIAEAFGSQCMVLGIEAKSKGPGQWECYFDNGREKSGRDVLDWASEGAERGAGEILLTSVDREGGQKGMDTDLIRAICDTVPVPVIASGGVGTHEHVADAIGAGVDAIAMAHVLHYEKIGVASIKERAISETGLDIRA